METQYVSTITSDDLQLIQKLIDIKNRGLSTNGSTVTNIYNKILNKHVPTTNCSSCIRSRISELERWYNNYKKTLELAPQSPAEPSKEAEVNNVPQQENKPRTKGVAKKSK